MKLLIITQKVDQNDDVLGFMHGWIKQFASECERVTVIALYVGTYDLPENVRVLSLGKESGVSRLKYVLNFYRYIMGERKNYDSVFVHMNQVYVLLGGFLWKMMGKHVGLWYAHGHVPLSLRLATQLTDIIFTSTKSGFRIASNKVRVVGQGIDMNRFTLRDNTQSDTPFSIAVVGRISPVKDYETLIQAVKILREKGRTVRVDIVGGAGTPEQESYFASLRSLVTDLHMEDSVIFHGAKPNAQIFELLSRAHLFVNTSRTGSFDKAVGEAMACGLPVLTCNEAFKDVLGEYATRLMFPGGDSGALAQKIQEMMDLDTKEARHIGEGLHLIIASKHSLENFIKKICKEYL